MFRFLQIQIYNSTGTEIEYDNKVDSNWGITAGSASLDSLIMDNEFNFSQLNSSKFEIQVFGIEDNLDGRKIKVSVDETVTGEEEVEVTKILFTGYIDSSKRDYYGTYRNIVAYDWIHYHRGDDVSSWWETFWQSVGTSGVTIADMRDSLLTYMGLSLPTGTFDNDDRPVVAEGMFQPKSISFEAVINMITVLQDFCLHIDGTGEAEYIKLSTTIKNVVDNIEGENSEWETYITNEITGVAVYDTADNLVQLTGTDTNVYKIVGNLLLLNQTAQEVTAYCTTILNTLSQIQYKPCDVKMIVSDLNYNLGDYIETEMGNTYIFKNHISGSLLVEQTLSAHAYGPDLNPEVQSFNQELISGAKISRLEQNIDGIETEIADLSRQVSSQITQMADKIVLQVNNAGVITSLTIGSVVAGGTADPVFQVSAENIDFIASDNIQLTSANLGITSTNFSVTPAGAINAKLGNIAGWTINANNIYNSMTVAGVEYSTTLSSSTAAGAAGFAFSVSKTESGVTTYPVIIRYNGKVECSNIIATGGSLGGWTMNANNIYKEVTASGVTYATTLSSSASGGENGFAFSISRTASGTTTYPLVIRNSGKLECSNIAATGDIVCKNLKATDAIKLTSSFNRDFTFVWCGGETESYFTRLYNGRDQARITFIDYDAGDWNGYAGYFTGGTWRFQSMLEVTNHLEVTEKVNIMARSSSDNAGLEIYGTSPYIDFHNSLDTTTDYTARIIHITSGNNKYVDFWASSTAWITCRALNFANQSSKHVKKNIKDITDDEAKKLLQLRPVSFDYKFGDATNQRGLIAEEVAEIMPEMVIGEIGEFEEYTPYNTPSIDYSKFVPYLIKMIQVQQKQIDELYSNR